MTNGTLLELAESYKALRNKKSELEQQLKDLNVELDAAELDLVNLMTVTDVPSFTHNGTGYALVVKEYISPVVERKSELYDTMKAQGFEHLFTINPQTLQATIKELKAENEDVIPGWLDGLVSIYEKSSIRLQTKK